MRCRARLLAPTLGAMLAALAAGCNGQVAGSTAPPGDAGDASKGNDSALVEDAPQSGNDTGSTEPVDTGAPPSVDGGDTCASPGIQCNVPPSAPSGATGSAGTTPHNYAIHQLFVGDTDRTGVPGADAWKAYGYNLDDLVTVTSSTDVCTLSPGAARVTQADGNGGIDNSFGENLLPIFVTTAGSDFSARVNASIASGGFTNLVYTVGFDDQAGNTTTAKGLSGVLLGGASYTALHDGGIPTWDLGTHWPILPDSLDGCPEGVCPAGTDPIAHAIAQFPSAYQKGGTFVSGPASGVVLLLPFLGGSLPLPIESVTITFGPNVPGSVTNGTIAGVMLSTQLVASFQAVAGSISTSLCSGSAFQSIAQQLVQAQDIVVDPATGAVSNSAGTSCNAISIGLGFNASEIAVPASSDITGPPPISDPCADQ